MRFSHTAASWALPIICAVYRSLTRVRARLKGMDAPGAVVQTPRSYRVLVFVGLGVVALLGGLGVLYYYAFERHGSPTNPFAEALQAPSSVYSYVEVYNRDSTIKTKTIEFASWPLSLSPNYASTSIASITLPTATQVITDSGKPGTILLSTYLQNVTEVRALDLGNGQMQVLLSLPTNNGTDMGTPRLINGGQTLAYITSTGNDRPANPVLHLFDLQKQADQAFPLSTDPPKLYGGFSIIAESADHHTLYIRQQGGDAGYIWSQWYEFDVPAQTLKKLDRLPHVIAGEDRPAPAAFSPEGHLLAYADFSMAIPPEALDTNSPSPSARGCLDYRTYSLYGEETGMVILRDMRTGNTTEVFTNDEFPNNMCSNIYRRIQDIKWIDATTLAVETSVALYRVDISTKQATRIFTLPTPRELNEGQPGIRALALPYILFNDNSIGILEGNRLLRWTDKELSRVLFFSGK
jgi:hypothetical protein